MGGWGEKGSYYSNECIGVRDVYVVLAGVSWVIDSYYSKPRGRSFGFGLHSNCRVYFSGKPLLPMLYVACIMF